MSKHCITSALLAALALTTGAQEFVSGNLRYRVVGDGEVAVAPWTERGASQYAGVLIVPETVYHDGVTCRVTTVADSAFCGSAITELQLPNSVTRIGRWAMADAFELTGVTLPLHLTAISRGMLAGTDITAIAIPERVTRIDDSAFEDCAHLRTVFLPPYLLEVGDYAFDGCTELFELYSASPEPPVWLGDDAMPDIAGVDLVLADDRAAAAWQADAFWGDHRRFSLWTSEDVAPTFELTSQPWQGNWESVALGRGLAYRVYGEDGYPAAFTTADHYFLPVADHPAEYVIVPTDGINDAEDILPVTVTAPAAPADEMAADRARPLIWSLDGVLHIEGDNHGTWTTIYDMYGRLYYERPSNDGQVITLHRGRTYIVIVGDYVKKVVL